MNPAPGHFKNLPDYTVLDPGIFPALPKAQLTPTTPNTTALHGLSQVPDAFRGQHTTKTTEDRPGARTEQKSAAASAAAPLYSVQNRQTQTHTGFSTARDTKTKTTARVEDAQQAARERKFPRHPEKANFPSQQPAQFSRIPLLTDVSSQRSPTPKTLSPETSNSVHKTRTHVCCHRGRSDNRAENE